jgi:hypothetical protein
MDDILIRHAFLLDSRIHFLHGFFALGNGEETDETHFSVV